MEGEAPGVLQLCSDPYIQVVQIISALKGRDSTAQGVNPGLGHENDQSAVSAKQNPCAVLSGLYFMPHHTQGLRPDPYTQGALRAHPTLQNTSNSSTA
jgi:hypothetical protein